MRKSLQLREEILDESSRILHDQEIDLYKKANALSKQIRTEISRRNGKRTMQLARERGEILNHISRIRKSRKHYLVIDGNSLSVREGKHK